MKRRFMAMLVCLCMVGAISLTVSAASLGTFTGTIRAGYEKKMETVATSAFSGTYIHARTAKYSQFGFYQSAVLGNGETQVSPAGMIDINVDFWCGFWSGYSTVPNNSVMAYMRSANIILNDQITSCSWWH